MPPLGLPFEFIAFQRKVPLRPLSTQRNPHHDVFTRVDEFVIGAKSVDVRQGVDSPRHMEGSGVAQQCSDEESADG